MSFPIMILNTNLIIEDGRTQPTSMHSKCFITEYDGPSQTILKKKISPEEPISMFLLVS